MMVTIASATNSALPWFPPFFSNLSFTTLLLLVPQHDLSRLHVFRVHFAAQDRPRTSPRHIDQLANAGVIRPRRIGRRVKEIRPARIGRPLVKLQVTDITLAYILQIR